MAEEGLKVFTSEAELKPPPSSEAELKPPPPTATEAVAESTDAPLLLEVEAGEPPLAALDLQAVELASIEPPVTAEGKVKESEAVEVVQRESPLEYLPPEVPVVTEHVTVAAVDKDAATHHVSQPLAVALGLSQEEVASPDTQMKEVIGPENEKKLTDKQKAPIALGSFKEESNKASDLSHSELNALEELKLIVQEALDKGALSGVSSSEAPEEVWIWGVPLMSDDRSDAILLKFLRAREFNVKESYAMLKNTIKWRRDFNVDELVKEDLGDELEKVVFMHGNDKEGHPVCYNVYEEFQNKELYAKTFGDEEKRIRFLRWRIQFLERSIRKLDFSPGGVNTIFQVSDLKNSPGPAKRELRIATNLALHILQDNYPEFVAKQVFINVPWWYLAFYTMISPFLTQRTKSKFVFAGPARTTETLFKYISPEQVPILYGGLSTGFCECNPEFTFDDRATEITIKPATKQTVEIIVNEKCILVWELRVVGWEVSYSAEFVPNSERSYTVIIQKTKKMSPTDEPVLSDRFAVSELGKILLIINNPVAKKKKLVYRFKVLPYVPSVKNA